MTKISSPRTFFYKKAFPILWFGVAASVLLTTLLGGAVPNDPQVLLPAAIVPIVMGAFGYLMFRMLVWNLADEVYDGGDFLQVRYRGEEENVPLTNIMNVSASTMINPPRVTLRLVHAGKFGSEISFAPRTRVSLNPFARNEVFEDLIVRVDQARSRRRN